MTLFCKIKMKFRIFNTYHIKSKQSRPNQAMPPKYQALTLGLVFRSFEITTAIETQLIVVYSAIFQTLADLTAWSNFANRFLLLFRLDSFIWLFTFQKKWIADSIHNLKGNCIVVSFSKKDTKPILVESCMENWKTWVRLSTKSSWFY